MPIIRRLDYDPQKGSQFPENFNTQKDLEENNDFT
jgi:hypothetical protein